MKPDAWIVFWSCGSSVYQSVDTGMEQYATQEEAEEQFAFVVKNMGIDGGYVCLIKGQIVKEEEKET